jgi:hypothetical protein
MCSSLALFIASGELGGLGWKWEVVEKGEFGGVDGIGKLSGPIEAGRAWAEKSG